MIVVINLLRILHQNRNLTLLGSYHKAEPYQASDVHHGNYNPSCKAKTNMQEDSDGSMTRARAKQLQRALTS